MSVFYSNCINFLLSFSASPIKSFGMPYDSGFIEFVQPNGQSFIARFWGDEFIWWMEDENGYRIVQGMDGYYYYAQLNANGEYEPTDKLVGKSFPPKVSFRLERSASRLAEIENERSIFEAEQQSKMDALEAGSPLYPTTNTFNLAVVLIDFADNLSAEKNYPKQLFDSLFFSTNYWIIDEDENTPHPEGKAVFGSFRDYYTNQSQIL